MPSRLWITISFLSLLFSLLITSLWIRSHYTADLIVYGSGTGDYHEYVCIPGQFRYTRVSGWRRSQSLRWFSGEFPTTRIVFGQQAVWK